MWYIHLKLNYSWTSPSSMWAIILLAVPTLPPNELTYFVDDPHLSQKVPKGNNFIVLFKIGVPHIINKFSLGSNLNLLESVANMLLSLKFMVQLHCNEWLDIAVFNIFEMFSLKIGDSHVFSCSSTKVVEDFSATYNLDNTCITTNYSRANFFLKWIFKVKQRVKSTHDLKITFSLQYGKSLSIVYLSFVLKSSEM